MYTINNFTEPMYRPMKTTDWCKDFTSVRTNKLIEIGFLHHNDIESFKQKKPVYELKVYLAKCKPRFFVFSFSNVRFSSDYRWTVYRSDMLVDSYITLVGSSYRLPDVWREIEGFE